MPATVTGWSIERYGAPEVLHPVTRPMPTVRTSDVLIRIHASAVTRADGMMRSGSPWVARLFLGLRRPRQNLIGTGFSGEVIAVGAGVTRFAQGDLVFGETGMQFGANASHICVGQDGMLVQKPATLSHEEAAVMCDGPLTSYHFLHHVARIRTDRHVLILGGAGSLGSAAVQIAAAAGCRVTATCSPRNRMFLGQLGADQVVDYTQQGIPDRAGGYDVIFDTIGISGFADMRGKLSDGGEYLCPVLSSAVLRDMLRTRVVGSRRARFAAVGMQQPALLKAHLAQLLSMHAAQTLRPVISRTYPLSDLVEAHRYVDGGHKRGNVVVV
ncbi:NAD(P)-dependent alcohol dehydrogenase [Jannaschia sp. 2305UL9-9]|uniref:NAD(P)-dependent alcohol dehydrogenase n=1 Tax=Jannaschia sp. 2305UL9-9 TaxID=3121638 RepID=UPI003527D228